MARKRNSKGQFVKSNRTYRVRYSGTRAYDTYGTLNQARSQARYAVDIGNCKASIDRKLPSGRWENVEVKVRNTPGCRKKHGRK